MRSPLLIDTSTTFEEYKKRLSKPSKKKYNAAMKLGLHCEAIDYDEELMWEYMRVWARQKVYGGVRPHITMTREKMAALPLQMFKSEVAVHAIEVYGDYAYAHPVRYDKIENPGAARFMWFKTIEWCCDHVNYLDMGAGIHSTWKSLVSTRKKYPQLEYKWAFVPKDVKDNPLNEEDYVVYMCGCGWKQLSSSRICQNCGALLL